MTRLIRTIRTLAASAAALAAPVGWGATLDQLDLAARDNANLRPLVRVFLEQRDALGGELAGFADGLASADSIERLRDSLRQLLPALARHRALRQSRGLDPRPQGRRRSPAELRPGTGRAGAFGYAADAAASPDMPRSTLWLQSAWDDASQDPRDGFDGYDADARGVLIGLDRRLTAGLSAGVALGQSRFEVDSGRLGRDDTDSDDLQAYLSWQPGDHRLWARIGLRRSDTDRERVVTFFRDGELRVVRLWSSIDSDERHLAAGWQWTRMGDSGWYLSPSLELGQMRFRTDDYVESGGGALGLLVETDDERQWLAVAGLRAGRFAGRGAWSWAPGAFVNVERQLAGDEVETTSTFRGTGFGFVSRGSRLASTAVIAGLDLAAYHAAGFGTSLGVTRTWQDDYRQTSLLLGVEFTF